MSEATSEDEENSHLLSDDWREDANNHQRVQANVCKDGLSWLTTSSYILALTAGAGLLVLPRAVEQAGPTGFCLLAFCAIVSIYSGHVLGKCWLLAKQRCSPELQEKLLRSPYPTIAEVAYGPKGSRFVSFCVNMSLISMAVIYILLASENVSKLLHADSHINFCSLILIFGCGSIAILVTCRSLKNIGFKVAAMVACLTICAASVMVCVSTANHDKKKHDVEHENPSFWGFFTLVGTLCFSFGGHVMFPTLQADMRKQTHFSKSVISGYIAVFIVYLPTCIAAYIKYGNTVPSNIMESVINDYPGPFSTTVIVCVTVHLLLCIVMVLNPVCRGLEHVFGLIQEISIKTAICRVLVMSVTILMALSIPHFSNIISIVGGSTMAVLQFVVPMMLYMKLCRIRPTGTEAHWGRLSIPCHLCCFNYEIAIVGCILATLATIGSILTMKNDYGSPCYLNFNQSAPL